MIYVDANVFIYAATAEGVRGETAAMALRGALRRRACTASLTADEMLWVLSKKMGRAVASEKVRQWLALDMQVAAVTAADVAGALEHFEAGVDPRDAIHAAVALRLGCREILSSDSDFDGVQGLKRRPY